MLIKRLWRRMNRTLWRITGRREDPLAVMEQQIAVYRSRGMKIGKNCYIGEVVFGCGGRDPITIGDDSFLTMCTILGHDASPTLFISELQRGGVFDRISLVRPTVIKDRCFIGVNAVVLCGVTIGPDAIVGAGAVVTRDVPPRTVVCGNPATVVCTIDEFVTKHRQQMSDHPDWYPWPRWGRCQHTETT